jgi:hypothetical protein
MSLKWCFRLVMLQIFCSTLQNVKAQANKSLGLVYPCASLSPMQRFNYLGQEISRLDRTQNHLNSFHTYMTNF